MTKTAQRLVYLVLFVATLSVMFGLAKQIAGQFRDKRKVISRELELKELEDKNRQLRAKLEEIKSPKYLEEKAATILGLSRNDREITIQTHRSPVQEIPDLILEPPLPNYKKWLNLFFGKHI